MTKFMLICFALAAIGMVAVLGWRGKSFDRPPLQAFDDMVEQPKYKAQAESAFFADGRTMRTPPAGTVAWGRNVAARDESLVRRDEDYYTAERFPAFVRVDRALIARGQSQFNVYCAVCHGGTGSGDGMTSQFGMNPPSYHTDYMRKLSVGQMYRTITEGKGLMGPVGDRLAPADRWAVVAYVRTLQAAANARLKDVPAEHRKELER